MPTPPGATLRRIGWSVPGRGLPSWRRRRSTPSAVDWSSAQGFRHSQPARWHSYSIVTPRKEKTMNYEILLAIIVAAVFTSAITRVILKELRHAFNVPEGWAGLVYRHGLYVRRHNAGRHVIWGFGWTVKLMDLRRTSLLVAGQEVLTADNISLKLSLLVTCRIADPAKAAHETQNWMADLQHTAQLAARSVVG